MIFRSWKLRTCILRIHRLIVNRLIPYKMLWFCVNVKLFMTLINKGRSTSIENLILCLYLLRMMLCLLLLFHLSKVWEQMIWVWTLISRYWVWIRSYFRTVNWCLNWVLVQTCVVMLSNIFINFHHEIYVRYWCMIIEIPSIGLWLDSSMLCLLFLDCSSRHLSLLWFYENLLNSMNFSAKRYS